MRERRFGNEEGAGDLGGGESAEGAQGERHLRLLIDSRMATGKDEPQAVVRKMHCFGIDLGFMVRFQVLGFIDQGIFVSTPGLFPAYPIDDLALCNCGDPGGRIFRHSLFLPIDER